MSATTVADLVSMTTAASLNALRCSVYLCCRPLEKKDVERLQELLHDLHQSFQSLVRDSRGNALQGPEHELFSGRVWTGRQAVSKGLIDNMGELKATMRHEYGDQVSYNLGVAWGKLCARGLSHGGLQVAGHHAA